MISDVELFSRNSTIFFAVFRPLTRADSIASHHNSTHGWFDLAEAILGKVAEVLRANQLQKALQLLQDMAKSNQALTVKHMAKLADSMGMRSLGLEICNGRYSTCWLGMNMYEHSFLSMNISLYNLVHYTAVDLLQVWTYMLCSMKNNDR